MIAAVVLAGCGKEAPPPAPKAAAPEPAEPLTVKIGAASPLTGSQAHIGIDIRNGVQLAIDDANAANIEIGGKKVKFEMVAEDDEANPTKATTVAQKLADAKVAAVVGHFNSGASIPASKIYSDAGIPQISPSSTNPKYTQQGFKTTFRVVAHDDQQGPTLARFAAKTLQAKSAAVIDDSTLSQETVGSYGAMLLLGSMHAEERLAAFLLDLTLRLSARGFSASSVVLRMSRADIDSFLGLKLETVSRTFSKFQANGLLFVQHRQIRITDPVGLQQIVDGVTS